jgi:hypothetical protein
MSKSTNAENQKAYRERNLVLGRTELRGIMATKDEQFMLKQICKDKLKEFRGS